MEHVKNTDYLHVFLKTNNHNGGRRLLGVQALLAVLTLVNYVDTDKAKLIQPMELADRSKSSVTDHNKLIV